MGGLKPGRRRVLREENCGRLLQGPGAEGPSEHRPLPCTQEFSHPAESLALTVEEVMGVRRVLVKAEMEKFLQNRELFSSLKKGKVRQPGPWTAPHNTGALDGGMGRAGLDPVNFRQNRALTRPFLFLIIYFIDYAIIGIPILPPLPPSTWYSHSLQQDPSPLFMSMGHTYKSFGFSISYTILNLPLSIL